MVGFTQGEVSSSFFATDEANDSFNCSGSDKEGNGCDLLTFLDVLNIYSGYVTPNCKGEVGLFLVPTPLEATVTTLVKNSLIKCWFNSTS